MKSIKSKNQSKEQKVIHPIPPYNGYGSEEDSLLNVFYLDISNKNKERYIDRFKKDKHILRFSAKMISSNPSNEERAFLISFFCGDETIQIFEIAGKNSGRESGKFLERQRIKNPYTHKYYTEKDFSIGNLIYVNTYIFKLIQSDEYTRKYMECNSDIFIDSNIKNVISRIRIGSNNFGDYQDFLIHLLYVIDPKANNYATKEDIKNGFKSFKIYLSDQELDTLISKRKVQGDMYSMEDLYNCLTSN
jgi:hypothetical protein